ncbi:MAG: MoaD/ThiS family protein [Acidimicrobiia bacterium]|nr:MoaD/ThiS family protein [Acidimicrobiia bacterium]
MATLRLFAHLRESAGTDSVEIDATTVGQLLDSASDSFGPTFAGSLASSGVWVNGEPADSETVIGERDEVAVIPPVSGGAVTNPRIDVAPSLLSLTLVVALLAVAWAPTEWFVVVAVGAVLAWVWDAWESARFTRDAFVIFPPLIAAACSGAFAYAWGLEGVAGALAVGVIISVSWPVFDRNHRAFRTTASTTVVSVVAVAAAGALVLMRLLGSYAVVAFVIITVTALVGAWLAGTYGAAIQSIDANVGALLGALAAGLVAGLVIEELDIAAGLLGGVAAAAGVIAGRAFGSMLRTGTVTHTQDAPGSLALFDGAIIAAPLFWLTLWVFG